MHFFYMAGGDGSWTLDGMEMEYKGIGKRPHPRVACLLIIHGMESGLHQQDAVRLACGDLLFGPDACLHFANMSFLEQEHAQAALPDASTNGIGQFTGEKRLVEGEILAVHAAALLKLPEEGLFADPYTHRR